jgi:hypothetical protein
MCTEGEKLIFCSCEGELDRTQPYWVLMRYVQTSPSGMRGKILMPSKALASGLGEALVLQHLVAGRLFDFEYAPQEKDWLRVHSGKGSSKYLSFYFQDGEWLAGRQDNPFDDEYQDIASGSLELGAKLPE